MSDEHSHPFEVPEPTGGSLSALGGTDSPVAETSVRHALPAEAPAIGAIQVAAWRRAYRDLLPAEVVDQLDPSHFAEQWRTALLAPGEARNRVMVALAGHEVVGFAATTPSDDPDADPATDALVAELCVDPEATRAGHGSRLLNAVVDTVRADGFTRLTIWVNSTDDLLRGFYTEAGWAPDGAHRELDLYGDGSVRVKQIRLHTDPGATTD
ncbi:MAG TPA: GNAT family N-acetyltransferase [Kribbella sp.]|nr:GNAT family N-acetyltransferase [Kribbella sp.]